MPEYERVATTAEVTLYGHPPQITERGADSEDDGRLLGDAPPEVHLQWKGTDVCLDFDCLCGKSTHYDGYFAAALQCAYCDRIYDLPSQFAPVERRS